MENMLAVHKGHILLITLNHFFPKYMMRVIITQLFLLQRI